MAININTDINVTTGGKLTDVGQIQGAWKTVDSESDMYALTASSFTKQNLQNGQMFYVSSSNSLYTLDVVGTFPIVTYNFNPFSWPGSSTTGSSITTASVTNSTITFTKGDQTTFDITIDTGSLNEVSKTTFNQFSSSINSFTSSIQGLVDGILSVTGSYATTGSNTFYGNQTIDGILIFNTQSSTPTYISGGVYLDSDFNLFLGSI